ncbi:putative 28S rRNA (cytosine-C(5))-methyltransferase [Bonamia ostreae]|uniref:28S rRNA (Cytosine-C(5))-methyltransferase n=1 Tax=Bonamia ostreae TaxID=126728 RepID=A0ABV2AJ21_9EUKA
MSKNYVDAGSVVQNVLDGKGLKAELTRFNNQNVTLLATETLKYIFVLDSLFKNSGFLKKVKLVRSKILVSVVMVYDLCLGQGKITGGGKIKKLIYSHQNSLKTSLSRIKISCGAVNNEDLIPKEIKNYNQMKIYGKVHKQNLLYSRLKSDELKFDDFIPDLLILDRNAIARNKSLKLLIEEGAIVVQDKSSCFPVFALKKLGFGEGDIIDACAAPGNKSLQLSNSFKKSRIFSFEINSNRFKTLKKRLSIQNTKNVFARNVDFLNVEHTQYSTAKAILIDPSCSGSGTIFRNIDQWVQRKLKTENELRQEMNKYSKLQYKLVCHAMKFPNVDLIIYSTCSVKEEENEKVVKKILQNHEHFGLVKILPKWKRRAFKNYFNWEMMVRVDHIEDETGGFFVAGFVRKKSGNNLDCSKNCIFADEKKIFYKKLRLFDK